MTFMNDVEELNLEGNYLSRFPLSMFKHQPYLRDLKVNSNFLFALPSDLFDFTASLLSIDFKNNNLKSLNKQSFINVPKLENVDFSNNNLESICKGLFAYQERTTIFCSKSHFILSSQMVACYIQEICSIEAFMLKFMTRSHANRYWVHALSAQSAYNHCIC